MALCISFHCNSKIQFPHEPLCRSTSSSVDRRKPSRGSFDDELASVKAAAWAWYQRGSGSESRIMREYDLAMPKRDYKPSRYKIESMKESEDTPLKQSSPPLSAPLSRLSSINSTQSEILDDWEIEGISTELDRYIASSRAEYLRSFLCSDYRARNRVASFPLSDTSEIKSRPKNKNSSGSWLKYTAVCGSRRDDVVVGRSFNAARSHVGRKSMEVKTSSYNPRVVKIDQIGYV